MEIFTKKFNEKCPSVPSDFVSIFSPLDEVTPSSYTPRNVIVNVP